ncbi:MAG: hypothetical protein AB7N65_10370 [Vicinamibacterales bacterium]
MTVPLGAGIMQIWGYVLGDVPAPLCQPLLGTYQGTFITTRVRVQIDDGGWVARADPPVGDFALHFSQTGIATAEGDQLAGSATGLARDTEAFPGGPPKDLLVSLSPSGLPAIVEGFGAPGVPFLRGTMKGHIRFLDARGGMSHCEHVWWTLQPAEWPRPVPPA